MNCKALPAGPASALGNAVLSLWEICRCDCPATSGLWVPGVLPGPCVCQAATPQPRTEPGRTTPTPCPCLHWGKSRNTNKIRKVLHSTGSLLWTVEGAGDVQNVPAVLLAPGRDMRGQFSARCGIAGKGWHVVVHVACCCACCMLLCFCCPLRCQLSSSLGAASSITLSPSLHDVWHRAACTFMLYCYTVQTGKVACWDNSQYKATRKTPSKSHPEQQ